MDQLANMVILLINKARIRKNQAHRFMQLLPLCKSSYVATNNTHVNQFIAEMPMKKFLKSDIFCRSSVPSKKYSCEWDTL